MNDEKRDTPDVYGSFEAWARVSATLLHLDVDERVAAIEDHGLTTTAWDEADAHWLQELAKDVVAGNMARPREYGELCAAEIRRRHATPAAPAAIPTKTREPEESANASEPLLVAGSTARAPLEPAPAVEVPSYLLDRPAVAAQVDPIDVAKASAALPSYIQSAREHPPVINAALPVEDINATAELRALPNAPTLPFGGKRSAAFDDALRAPKEPVDDVSESGGRLQADSPGGETAAVPSIEDHGSPLPFDPRPATSDWTVEQFASICAELSVTPSQKSEILRRYGTTDEEWRTRYSAWMRRLGKDDAEMDRWRKLQADYRKWLSSGGYDRR